jgi:hypothetical protein
MRITVRHSRNRREFLDDIEQFNTTVVLYTDSKTPKSGEQQAITAMWRNVFGRRRRGHAGSPGCRQALQEFSEFRVQILMSSERLFKSVFQNLSYVNAFHSPGKDQNDENK